jgi:hypothetical protein
MNWFSLVDPIAWMHPIVLQTPTPEVKASPDVELLKSQLEFLKADHARLASDFVERMKQLTAQSESVGKDVETYLSRMFALTAFATTLATGFVGWFGWQTRKDAKASVKAIVDRQLAQVVAETVDREIQLVRRSISREQIIDKTPVDYFLQDGVEPSEEIRLLRTRGFNNPRFCKNLTELRRNTGDLVVVDFEHWRPDGQARLVEMTDKEDRAKAAIEELIRTLPSGTILLVYVNGFIKCLNDFPKSQVVMSNSEVALIGNLVDAAYVSKNRN